MKEGDFSKGPACRASAGDDSIRKNRTSCGISAVAWLASQPEEQSSTISCRETWACSSQHTEFCLLCHAATNPEQLYWNGGNYSRFMPVLVKGGFLLNGLGQPLARWKGKKWLSFRQLLLIPGFCQAQSHRFPCFFLPFFFSLPPLFFFLSPYFYFFSPEWVTALCTAQKRGLNFWGKKGSSGRMKQPESLLWARSLWRSRSLLLEAFGLSFQNVQYWLLLLTLGRQTFVRGSSLCGWPRISVCMAITC